MPMGWIKFHRKIMNHWLYREQRVFSRFEAWTYLMLMANHSDNEFIMNGSTILVKRGCLVTSIKRLGEEWKWSRTKVKKFLDVLQKDAMINYTCDSHKTIISLTNYCLYQDDEDDKNTSKVQQKDITNTSEKHHKDTNNNDEECIKNEKKIKFAQYVSMTNAEYLKLVGAYGEEYTRAMIEVLDNYKGATGKSYKSDYRAILNWVADKVLKENRYALPLSNAAAYKKDSEKCPYCRDSGWVMKNGSIERCKCTGGNING